MQAHTQTDRQTHGQTDRQTQGPGSAFVRAADSDFSHEEHVRPMFEVVWASMLSAFSHTFEVHADGGGDANSSSGVCVDLIGLCMEGFTHAIRLAGRFDISIARDTFVTVLTKFPHARLHQGDQAEEHERHTRARVPGRERES